MGNLWGKLEHHREIINAYLMKIYRVQRVKTIEFKMK